MPRSQKPRGRPGSALPDFIPPELATLVDAAPDGPEWLHEMKLDGYRMAARMAGGKVAMLTRHGLDWTARFRPIAAALAGLPAKAAYLDGEVAVVGEDGVTSFAALQDALSRGQATRLTYHLFDILHLDGSDLTGLPLSERKQILSQLLGPQPAHALRYSDHIQGQGQAFFKQACRLGLEGIVSKLASAPYRSRRTAEWLKVKCLQRQEFVIGGWQESDKEGRSLRSLLLGYYDRAGALVFAGKAGTGFALRLGHDLVARLRQMERPDSPFASVPRPYQRGAHWAEPRLVAEVAFSNWTTDKLLRHPSFDGLREDKPAREVGLERPVSPKRATAKRTPQRPSLTK
jgi:bifunctional non-homologous end joining protein LigD